MIYYQQTRTSRNFVNKSNHTERSNLQTIRLPILLSTAIVVIILCSSMFSWYQESLDNQTREFSLQYNQGMADLSAAYLGHLIEDENTDAIESIGLRLNNNKNIQKLAIYRRNGELIYSAGDADKPHSDPVIANISYEDNYNGYLVIYFIPATDLIQSEPPFWLKPFMIWGIGATLWLLLFFLLTFIRRKKEPTQTAPDQTSVVPPQTAKKNEVVLKELIKRNRKQLQNKTIQHSLVIKAEWSKLDAESNALLLRVLSRWLPQNGLLATQFSDGLLVLGLDPTSTPLNRNPLHALERCLQQLQLQPKILLHHLNFDREIYHMFFDIIEPGVWFEKKLRQKDDNYDWPSRKLIDIELDTHDIIELCQLEEPDAEQRGLIERQVRFLSED